MPSPNPATRHEYAEAAVATVLTGSITAGSTSFTIAANTGWPTGAVGPFIVTLDRGTTEERILCASQSGGTVTVAASGRGYNGTTAQAHASGATAEHGGSAFDFDQFNQHIASATAVHGVATVAGVTEAQTLTNKNLTGAVLDATSTLGGVSGTTLNAEHTAQTAAVSLGGQTGLGGSGTLTYYKSGKWLVGDLSVTVTSASTGDGNLSLIGVPAQALTSSTFPEMPMGTALIKQSSGTAYLCAVVTSPTSGTVWFIRAGGVPVNFGSSPSDPYRPALGDVFQVSFSYRTT